MCITAFITAADLLPTMTTSLRQIRANSGAVCGAPVRGIDQRLELGVGEFGKGGHDGLVVGVHPIVHRD